MNQNYTVGGQEKRFALIMLVAGAVLALIGAALNIHDLTRIWTGLMYTNAFFVFISLLAVFFIASQTVGYNGWFTLTKRVFEGIAWPFLPIGMLLMIVILFFGMEHIYHWTYPEAVAHDPLLQGKEPYLNVPFFLTRAVLYLGLWSGLAWLLRRNSLSTDTNSDIKLYQRSKYISAAFIVVFAVTSSTASWDWFMSVQPHWYSTLWGWYVFAGMFATCMAVAIIILAYLKSKGLLPQVNGEHFNDIGKLLFAFSTGWAYLFYSQYMLIWYANIPEETGFYRLRIDHIPLIMWTTVALNFFIPFLTLITRGAKRQMSTIVTVSVLVIIGHWLDFYQMTMPGAVANMAHGDVTAAMQGIGIGAYEIGLFLLYGGLFAFVVLRSIASIPLVQKNHPFLKESVTYHV